MKPFYSATWFIGLALAAAAACGNADEQTADGGAGQHNAAGAGGLKAGGNGGSASGRPATSSRYDVGANDRLGAGSRQHTSRRGELGAIEPTELWTVAVRFLHRFVAVGQLDVGPRHHSRFALNG